ncbi:uncharacterized protein METZ01_LOCUS456351, partial [marine metagenome]
RPATPTSTGHPGSSSSTSCVDPNARTTFSTLPTPSGNRNPPSRTGLTRKPFAKPMREPANAVTSIWAIPISKGLKPWPAPRWRRAG